MLTEKPPIPDFDVDRELGFAARLFADVDRPDSTVNIVIGARRFIAGWNSWRVGTMGLMHVGVSEGPEIIQMFGRGVRLKGWNMSLKRHRESAAELPPNSAALQELETLYIFGLRANYMQTFRDLLHAEGMPVDRETTTLPVTWNFGRQRNLKLIRLRKGLKYEHSDRRPVLPDPGDADSPPLVEVEVDLHSRLQAVASSSVRSDRDPDRTPVELEPAPRGVLQPDPHSGRADRAQATEGLAQPGHPPRDHRPAPGRKPAGGTCSTRPRNGCR